MDGSPGLGHNGPAAHRTPNTETGAQREGTGMQLQVGPANRARRGAAGSTRRRLLGHSAGVAGAGVTGGALLAACAAPADPASSGAPAPSTQPVTLRLNVRAGGDEALWKFLSPS